MRTADTIAFAISVALIAFLLVLAGAAIGFRAIADECEAFGSTEIYGTVYECRAVRNVR